MHQDIAVVGVDLAKRVFQVHAISAEGAVAIRRKLRRGELIGFFADLSPCLIGMEACASAHHWARELQKLGHEVRLMPPAYVKPYVKRGKTDAADAEAICEAVTRPTMRFVPVKSRDQQGVLMLHKTRDLLVRQRTALINALRAHLAEYGIVTATGPGGVKALTQLLHEEQGELPDHARSALFSVVGQLDALQQQIDHLEEEVLAWHRSDDTSRRLATIPGIGPITASAIAAAVPDPGQFRSGRQFAAWLGLTPRPHSSGGKERLGGISKQGDGYLRRLLVVGATAVVRMAKRDPDKHAWLAALLERKTVRVATVALANKTARVAWSRRRRPIRPFRLIPRVCYNPAAPLESGPAQPLRAPIHAPDTPSSAGSFLWSRPLRSARRSGASQKAPPRSGRPRGNGAGAVRHLAAWRPQKLAGDT